MVISGKSSFQAVRITAHKTMIPIWPMRLYQQLVDGECIETVSLSESGSLANQQRSLVAATTHANPTPHRNIWLRWLIIRHAHHSAVCVHSRMFANAVWEVNQLLPVLRQECSESCGKRRASLENANCWFLLYECVWS